MLAGVSTRRLRRTREPVGEQVTAIERSVSKSSVSRAFVAKTGEILDALMARSLADVRLAVLMIDGIDLKGRTNVVALGISTDGVKLPLGLWEGSKENAAVATSLLSDLVARGLDVEQGVLCVLDGSNDEDFETIVVQLRALGLIHRSERKRPVAAKGTYWSLTPFGDTHLTTLRAIRREPIELTADSDQLDGDPPEDDDEEDEEEDD